MAIWQIDKLTLFLLLFIPGFISLKVYDLLVPSERRDFSKSLFEVIGYSALNFAALSWLIVLVHANGFPAAHSAWYLLAIIFVLFIAPVLWPCLWLKLCSWPPVARRLVSPVRKPWDYVFGKRESYWVIVHLKDGRRVGGRFDTQSFASSSPAEHEIYLEQIWKLSDDGDFLAPVEYSKGMIILEKDIVAVELFGVE